LRSPGHARTAIRSPADRHESWRSDHRSMRETAPNGQAPSGGGPRAPSRKYSPRPRPSRAGALCCGAGTRLPRSALSDRRGVGPPSYLHPLQSGGADPSPLPHAALTGSPAVADPARTHGSRSGQPAPSWQPTAGVLLRVLPLKVLRRVLELKVGSERSGGISQGAPLGCSSGDPPRNSPAQEPGSF
jgi:hypothetical protein